MEEFKKNSPEYVLPERMQIKDGRSVNSPDNHWYHIYFYYPKENQIIKAWTRPSDGRKTTFAFVGLNEGLTLGHWKQINKDFSRLKTRNKYRNLRSGSLIR